MKIGFDAKRAFFNYSGLGNYSRNIIQYLARYYPGHSYYLYIPRRKEGITSSLAPDQHVRYPGSFLTARHGQRSEN